MHFLAYHIFLLIFHHIFWPGNVLMEFVGVKLIIQFQHCACNQNPCGHYTPPHLVDMQSPV